METNLTISIIDECLKNTDSECEDILKTKEALSILKQGATCLRRNSWCNKIVI